MRNVKVNVQADTSQAVGKVRELTGALSQLDAVTRRNVQVLLQALGNAGLKAAQIGTVSNQQAAAGSAQAQLQAGRSNVNSSGANPQQPASNNKAKEAFNKLNSYSLKTAESQFTLFADDLAQVFSKAFSELFQGGFKNALSGLKESLKGLFNNLLKKLVEDVADKIRKSISKQISSSFNRNSGGLSVGTGSNDSNRSNDGQTSTPGLSVAADAVNTDIDSLPPEQLMDIHRSDITSTAFTNTSAPPAASEGKDGGTKSAGAKTGLPGNFNLSSFGKLIGSMAPALGSSLGGMLGGPSTVGSIMGSLGGLAGGTALGIATGAITQGTAHSGFSILGMSIGGAASLGILAGVAVALMVGSYILGKNKQRKMDEKTRNQAMVDAFSQLDEILKQINRDEIDGASGVSQASNIRKQYVEQMSKLKDKKTRNIALKDVSRIDSKISLIKQAADNQSARKALDAKLVPTFADGGLVGAGNGYRVLGHDGGAMSPFRGRVPGVYDRRDDFLARLSGNEVVLTPDQWMPIAPYLKHKRVPGFADGGLIANTSSFAGTGQAPLNQEIIIEELIINLSNQFGAETAAKIIDVGLKTPDGRQAVVKSVRTHIGESGLGDGLIRDINKVNSRGF